MQYYLTLVFFRELDVSKNEIIAIASSTVHQSLLKKAHVYFCYSKDEEQAIKTICESLDGDTILTGMAKKVESKIIMQRLPKKFIQIKSAKHYFDTCMDLLLLPEKKSLDLVMQFYEDLAE